MNRYRWLLVLLLPLSFIAPGTNLWWRWIDEKSFYLLHSLLENPSHHLFWGYANSRYIDWISASLMALIFIRWVEKGQDKVEQRRRFGLFLHTLVTILFAAIFTKFCIAKGLKLLQLARESPTLQLGEGQLVSLQLPTMTIRAASKSCFPGDHALVLFLWALFLIHHGGRSYLLPTSLYALFLSLPRLVLGAHWLSDDLVGSLSLAIAFFSISREAWLEEKWFRNHHSHSQPEFFVSLPFP